MEVFSFQRLALSCKAAAVARLFNVSIPQRDLEESLAILRTSSATRRDKTQPDIMMSSDEEFGVSDDEPGVAKEIFESSDDGGEAAVPALGNQLCCEQEFFSSSDESPKPESSCQTGKKEVVARSASKRAYTNRRSRTGAARFLGKPVCLQALRRLLAIGTSTLDKLRHSQVAFTGRSARPKHPIFGFCLDGEASAKWHSVAVFLWHIYHSSAEFMPSNLRLPRGRKETPEPFDRATVDGDDQDFSVRYVSKVLSELHEYSADINVKMLGPGGDDVPKRWLQHSNRTELYHEYVAYSEANNLKPASYSTFLKVVNCVMKPGMRGSHLAFRKAGDHAQCDVCWKLKRCIRQSRTHDERMQHHKVLIKHTLSQWLDRQEYWRHRALSHSYFQQFAEMGEKLLGGPHRFCGYI